MELYNFYSFDSKSTGSQFLTDSVSTIFQKYWRKRCFLAAGLQLQFWIEVVRLISSNTCSSMIVGFIFLYAGRPSLDCMCKSEKANSAGIVIDDVAYRWEFQSKLLYHSPRFLGIFFWGPDTCERAPIWRRRPLTRGRRARAEEQSWRACPCSTLDLTQTQMQSSQLGWS